MVNKLKEKRAGLIANARVILDKASAESRDLNSDEQTQYASMEADIESLGSQIQREERLVSLETELRSSTGSIVRNLTQTDTTRSFSEQRQAVLNYIRTGERRATSGIGVAVSGEGGALAHSEFVAELFSTLAAVNVMRQIGRVLPPVNSNQVISSFAPTGSAAWVDEEGAYTAQTPATIGTGSNSMGAYKAGALIKVSEELLQDSDYDVESMLVEAFSRYIGTLEESGYVAGDGTGEPTGVSVSAGTGKTAASASAVTAAELIDLFHSLKPQYRAKASFLMNDSTALAVRKLADSTGQFLWQPGLAAGAPDRMLGRPVFYSAAMPVVAASAKVICFGDFSQYVICDRKEVGIQRLNELYAATGQVGFKMFKRSDGKLMITEAVKALVMAAS